MANNEGKVQSKIIKYLDELGWYILKIGSATKKGKPDLICCDTQGKFWAFEVKAPGGTATKLQLWNVDQILDIGGRAFVVDSLELVKHIVIANGHGFMNKTNSTIDSTSSVTQQKRKTLEL